MAERVTLPYENISSSCDMEADPFLVTVQHRNDSADIDIDKELLSYKKQDKEKFEFVPQRREKIAEPKKDFYKEKESIIEKQHLKPDSKMTLSDMEEQVLKVVTIIRHEKRLYYYTGRTYEIIEDRDKFLEIVRSRVSNSAFDSCSNRKIFDLFDFMRARESLMPKNYNKKISEAKFYVVFRNGVLNLKTFSLMEHSKEYLTFYELDAEWIEDDYPSTFYKFLKDISGDDASIKTRILETMGYLLSPYNHAKKFFVMGTARDSGKSTMGELLRQLIGPEHVGHLSANQLGKRFALGNIEGKILNSAMDLPKGEFDSLTVSIIKQITGGDTIATEQKYEKIREVHSNLRFLFASNYPVTISKKDDDDAFWERMIVVPFIYSMDKSKQDADLLEKLLSEKEKIIYVCLKALHIVLKRDGQFSPCAIAEEMKDQWRYGETVDLSYTLQQFTQEYIDITNDEKDDVLSVDLYEKYKDYCERNQLPTMKYDTMLAWYKEKILYDEKFSNCKKKRVHHEAKYGPRAGFSGMKYKESI